MVVAELGRRQDKTWACSILLKTKVSRLILVKQTARTFLLSLVLIPDEPLINGEPL